jgi:hypothetical protein
VNSKPPAVTPNALAIGAVLESSVPLVRLQKMLRDSTARFEAIRPHLPAALVPLLKAGPLDELGWSLLAANSSVAAKLRHLQPRLEQILQERGLQTSSIRIKVQQN